MSTSAEEIQPTTSTGQFTDQIFELFKANKVSEAIEYIKEGKLSQIDCVDHHGTTALQYAAFRGLYEVCDLLLKKGADVNAKTHDQGYSALMFAAIGNHKRVVSLLLEHDADVDYTNMIGRTAAQMAAFVNSHESVDLINSYISKASLEYFTETHSIYEKEPKLPKGKCLDELHRLLISSNNYSPVFVIKSMVKNNEPVLLDNMDRVIQTLDAFSTKVFKVEDTECPNDLLAFKLHYYKYLFEYVRNHKKLLVKKIQKEKESSASATADAASKLSSLSLNEQDEKFVSRLIESSIKTLLAEEPLPDTKPPQPHKVYEEKFLRESIRQFPYRECALVRQMATILAQTQIGKHPSALYVITSCLNGQRLNSDFNDEVDDSSQVKIKPLECRTCTYKSIDVKLCTHCRQVAYCDKFCQKLDWPAHKNQKTESEKTKD